MEKKVKKHKNWSLGDMNDALSRIEQGELTIRSAAKTYQIPRSTLQDKIKMRSPLASKQVPTGRPLLTQDTGKKVKSRQSWSQEDMNNAVHRVKLGELTIRSASKTYQIPRSTLQDKIKMRSPLVGKNGPKPILTQSEEEAITRWTIHMDRLGLGQTKTDIQNVVKQMLDKNGQGSIFTDNRPGKTWFSSFRQRNPGLVLRQSQPFCKSATVITPFMIDEWFTNFLQDLEDINAHSILNEPARLYKCEESSFQLGGRAGKRVFKGKTTTKVSKVSSSDDSQITVLAAVSAQGNFPPPLIVFPSKEPQAPRTCQRGALKGCVCAETQNGVINSSTFLAFLTEIFLPFLIEKRVPCPVLLFVNERSKYQSPEVTKFCSENGILPCQVPPHAASATQISDISVAGCLNVEWDSAEKAYRGNHPGCSVNKTMFPSVFREAWKRVIAKPSLGVEGFEAIGVYPFTRMYNLTKSVATTAGTSKDFWPPNSDFALMVGDSTYSDLDDGTEAAGSTLSTSAEVPLSLHPPARDTMAVLPPGSSETTPDRTVILPGLAPIQVSSRTATLLSSVVGVLENNGSITLHMDKQAQDRVVPQTQEGGIHCSTCRCSVVEPHQVPKELWNDFLKYKKKKQKRRRRELEEHSSKRKGKKRQDADVSRKGKKKEADMSLERKGKKRKNTDVSQEIKGKKRRGTDVSQERKGKKRRGTDVSQEKKGEKKQDVDSSPERNGKKTSEADVSHEKETGEREQEKQKEETAEREQERPGMVEGKMLLK